MDRALIVEDDRDQAELAANLVRLRRFEPVLAETGETGLDLARTVDPAVVLLDVMLPDTDGFDVCKQLRGDRATMAMPIVMLTALSDQANRRRGYRVGANAYVSKPYDAAELYAAIDRARAWRAGLDDRRVRGEILVELDSETAFLQDVNDWLAGLVTTTPLTPSQASHLRQAVMELGMNAIEWGNRYHSDKLVRIVCRVHDDRIEIVIKDEGPGFDPGLLPHAASPDDPTAHMDVREKLGLRVGGFGLMISRGMVDELAFNEAGNEVTMVVRFRPDAGATPEG